MVVWIFALTLLHAILLRVYLRLVVLPEEAYFRPKIFPSAIKTPRLVAFLVGVNILPLIQVNTLAWSNLTYGDQLRWFIFFIAAIIVWTYSTYNYNFYYNQTHALDRLLLVIWCIGILAHPIFVNLVLAHALIVLKQFHYPLGSYTWTDKRVLFDILILFSASLYFAALGIEIGIVFVFVLICMHAANYLLPGIGKLRIGWYQHEKIYYLSLCGYANGWKIVSQETLKKLVPLLKKANWLFIGGTLVIELLPLAIWGHPLMPPMVFALAILLHIGIFTLSGILFWKWILLNIGLIVLTMSLPSSYASLFSWQSLFLSFALFAVAPWLFSTITLAWFDTPLTYTFDLTAVGVSGSLYSVSRGAMSPYDVIFAQNRFSYTVDQKFAVGVFGTTPKLEIVQKIEQAQNHPNRKKQIDMLGSSAYSKSQTARLQSFLVTYLANLNHQTNKNQWFTKISAPQHIWTMRQANHYAHQEQISHVNMQMSQIIFDGETFETLDSKIVLTAGI